MKTWIAAAIVWLSACAAGQQTPRQALIEMLTATSEKNVERHLPEALLTRMNAMKPKDGKSSVSNVSIAGKDTQFFESGPLFAVYMPEKAMQRFEVLIARDEMLADGDHLEFAFRVIRDGKEVSSAVTPTVLARMKQEAGTWRLAEVGISARVQLDDGEKLDELTRSVMTAMAAASAKASTQTSPPARRKIEPGEWKSATPTK